MTIRIIGFMLRHNFHNDRIILGKVHFVVRRRDSIDFK